VATIHDEAKRLGRLLPRPSAIFHAYASADIPWVTRTLSHYTPMKRGKVSSNSSTHEVLGLRIPYVPYALVHSSACAIGLNRWGLPPWSSEFQIRSLPFLPTQYSPLSPTCPTRSPIMPTIRSSC
jgi:hypothetical protein